MDLLKTITRHPHPEAVARVLVADQGERSLLFNYTRGSMRFGTTKNYAS
jgi:hypothetical protein